MKFKIPYGKEHSSFEIDDSQIAAVLEPGTHRGANSKSQEEIIEQALNAPIGTQPLRVLAQKAQRFFDYNKRSYAACAQQAYDACDTAAYI